MVSIYVVTQTSLTYLALHLFMATQVQQFVLHDIVPFLVALSWPGVALKEGGPRSCLRLLQKRPVSALLRIFKKPLLRPCCGDF